MNDSPIPREILDAACRKMCRRIASTLIRAMAETDTSFALMAVRIGVPEKKVRKWMDALLDGTGTRLRPISDMCTAMGCELDFHVTRRAEPKQEE